MRERGPVGVRAPIGQARAERFQRAARVGLHGERAVLEAVERIRVDADDTGLREERVRAGREILQARADGKHAIGLAREDVRGARASHADRPGVQRVVPRECAFARLSLAHRNAVPPGEGGERLGAAAAVQHAAARDDHRARSSPQARERGVEFVVARSRGRERCHARRKEVARIVPGHRLHVLRQGERDGAAQRRVGEDVQRAAGR